jgi:hypothetical protein
MPISIQVIGADRLASTMEQAAVETLPTSVHQAMLASVLLIEADARRNVKRDTGRLQNSITYSIVGKGGNLTGRVGPSVGYGLYVEMGRKPGKQPPIGAIAAWAHRHGINPFVVARAIGRKGVKAQPFLIPAFEKNQRRIEELFFLACSKVVSMVKGA